MRLRFADAYLRGRLARRLLMVFVLASLVPVLLTSFLGYRQLVRGAAAERARALHEEAKESALTFLAQLQSASAELALLQPLARTAADAPAPRAVPFTEITYVPVGSRAQWLRALAGLPERMRAPLMAGHTVLAWSRSSRGPPQLTLIRPLSGARLARGILDTARMLEESRPTGFGTGIAVAESGPASPVIRSDGDPVPLAVFERMAGASVNGAPATLWRSRDGRWRGSDWNLFLQSSFEAPPIRLLVCESASDSIAGLAGLRFTIPLMLLGAMAFAAWLAIAQLRRYLGPLETLTTATRQLGASNFEVQVHIRTGDELSELGEDFNRMARSLRDQHRELQRQAQVDGLTGLTNRDFFHHKICERLALEERSALLYVDLDEFKKVNDSAGHEAGDKLLQEVARRLRESVRRSDTVARLGGDEFAVLLADGAGAEEAAAAARTILKVVQAPILVAGAERRVSASIGIALMPRDGTTADLILRNADIAMYQAKERGRNGLAVFSPEMHRRMEERISLEIALQSAVARSELRLHYQPITSAGRLSGLEALVRWANPAGIEVGPAQFIPVAEQSGLILNMGDWVLGQACADFARWRAEGIAPQHISVNVSAKQLQSSEFAANLEMLLRDCRIRPAEVQLELTESAVADGPGVAATLERLHESGVRLALDDFGTGYSSLSQLQQLPFDVVKIDRSFIVGLPENLVALQLVRTILRMVESLDKLAVAEGVETQAQRDLLEVLGCGAMQGYFFGRPMPEPEIRALLEGACEHAPYQRAGRLSA